MDLIENNMAELARICEKHHVSELYLFGSVLTNQFNNKSDLDFLVKFGKVDLFEYFDNYSDFKSSLEFLYSRKVDLVEAQTVKNPILKRTIERTKKLIYGRENTEVFV